mmetsp:Transcript_78137/g.253566  ORF Transcript_78137/g.253566 Transcript_78137/m.253566 type:complete len:430 (+) Transcript_78137:199-1488(+)
MKINTMYKMRTDITYIASDSTWTCPFLYLTNTQANHIPRDKMPRIREVMGLEGNKMVIRLLPSYYGPMYGNTFPFETRRFPCRDLGQKEIQKLSEHLTLLAKEVLLPLAIKTGALIIGTDTCELALAFLRVAAPVQRQLGDACPFKVLFFLRAPLFDLMSNDSSTCVYHFKDQCKHWMRASKDHEQAAKNKYGEDGAFHPHGNIIPGYYCVIMFESLSKDGSCRISEEAGNRFQNDFISSLADTHPVIGLQTLGTHNMDFLLAVADHASRGMPLMLLDSRDRHSKSIADACDDRPAEKESLTVKRLKECERQLKAMAAEWQGRGVTDRHTTSMIAYVKTIFQTRGKASGGHQKKMWIWQAIEMKRGEEGVKASAHSGCCKHQSEEDPYLEATNLIMRTAGANLKWEADYMRELPEHIVHYSEVEDVGGV